MKISNLCIEQRLSYFRRIYNYPNPNEGLFTLSKPQTLQNRIFDTSNFINTLKKVLLE